MKNDELIEQLTRKVVELRDQAGEASDICKNVGHGLDYKGYCIEVDAYKKVLNIINELQADED